MITAQAPGKLYVLGEYAVVEPGHRAVLVAVDRRVRVDVEEREADGLFHAEAAGSRGPLGWRHRKPAEAADSPGEHVIEVDEDASGFFRYLASATRTVERLRAERGLDSRHYAVSVTSALDDAVSGAKFGLGSSAAVTVAAVGAVGAFYGLDLSAEQAYRLAMLATVQVTASTSGGDLAASALGGWVSYASPDRQWLLAELDAGRPVAELLAAPWPGLVLERIGGPEQMPVQIRVGWTGRPADTPDLVGRVRRDAGIPQDLLDRSDAAVEDFLDAARRGAPETAGDAVARARAVLAELAAQRGTAIETPELEALARTARVHGWWGKSSGAGGGDCGIALAPADADPRGLERAWQDAGIRPLDLQVSAAGLRTASADGLPTTTTSATDPEGAVR